MNWLLTLLFNPLSVTDEKYSKKGPELQSTNDGLRLWPLSGQQIDDLFTMARGQGLFNHRELQAPIEVLTNGSLFLPCGLLDRGSKGLERLRMQAYCVKCRAKGDDLWNMSPVFLASCSKALLQLWSSDILPSHRWISVFVSRRVSQSG